jgi:cytochrome c-type biogenesis protein CcmH
MIMRRLSHLLVVLTLLAASPTWAVQPDEVLSDPTLETRARALSKELRCMVCQNQSIDDSDAPLARDLRILVRERISAGDTDREVLDFLVARYGEFVLLKPRLSWRTALLWSAPVVLFAGGLMLVVVVLRRRSAGQVGPATAPLTEDERARLALLRERGQGRDRSFAAD